MVLATTRADVNGVVRRRMDVRKVSFAAMADAVEITGMEYGGITPIGLPDGWPILIDAAVAAAGPVVIGSGIRGSKIVIDGSALGRLPGAEVVEGLAGRRAGGTELTKRRKCVATRCGEGGQPGRFRGSVGLSERPAGSPPRPARGDQGRQGRVSAGTRG